MYLSVVGTRGRGHLVGLLLEHIVGAIIPRAREDDSSVLVFGLVGHLVE